MSNLTELVFILDRSGSMSGLESDTIGGFNSMLVKQQAEAGECRITTVLFDTRYEILHDRLDIKAVSPLSETDYQVGGGTALLDAIGRTIRKIANTQRVSKPEYRADKVLFVITTDGEENSSHEYNYARVRKQIEKQKSDYGWEFIFLGANIDAISVAQQIGIAACRAQNYCADDLGVGVVFRAVSAAATKLRNDRIMDSNWKDTIEEDYQKRGRK